MTDPQRTSDTGAPLFSGLEITGATDATDDELDLADSGSDPGSEDAARRRRLRRVAWMAALVVAAVAVTTSAVVYFTRDDTPHLATPAHLAGMSRDDRADATDTAGYLRNALAAGMNLANPVGAVYTDGQGDAHSVIFAGGASSQGSQNARLSQLFDLIDDATDGIAGLTTEPAGSLGGTVKCGLSTDTDPSSASPAASPDTEMAVCGWADGATVGIAMFPNRSVSDSAALLRAMRSGIQGK